MNKKKEHPRCLEETSQIHKKKKTLQCVFKDLSRSINFYGLVIFSSINPMVVSYIHSAVGETRPAGSGIAVFQRFLDGGC
ncbi:hypothetical protein ACOJQI_01390 [Bacillus salacetis]|uniref:hypothetical protein n=1 Tax=Bacillus salacetis TaxID=2315464 RepID=UPI003B9E54CA